MTNFTWKQVEQMAQDPDFRRRNADLIREMTAPKTPAKVKQSKRGKQNVKEGRRFEDEVDGVMTDLWVAGVGMVFKTDAKSKVIGPGRIVYEKQDPFGPPLNPPDFMGVMFGVPVGFDAKVSRSSNTYYATRAKKKFQHSGIVSMSEIASCGFFGYLIQWGDEKISFNPVYDCIDGKVRRKEAEIVGSTVREVLEKWVLENIRNLNEWGEW